MLKRKKSRSTGTADDETKTKGDGSPDLSHSVVLGGMKDPTLNSRVPGTESPSEDDGITHFKVPFGEKAIVCEKHHSTNSKPAKNDSKDVVALIFTHGAGGGIANPATRDFAIGFGALDPMVCYQGTMNLQNRVKGFHAVMENVGGKVEAIGGRSMGARAAVLTALERKESAGALVLVSWPLLTGKGEREPERREQILTDLPEGVDVLFVLGTEDKQCPLKQFEEVRGKMKAKTFVVEVKGADHGMSLKQKGGVQAVRRETGTLSARWLKERTDMQEGGHCSVEWDENQGDVIVSEWRDTEDAQQRKARRVE